MTWEDKVEMASLFNNGQLEEAISFFGRQEDWDLQAIDMFVTCINLFKCELCLPLDERIQKINASSLPSFRSQLRLAMLQRRLDELQGRKQESDVS